MLDHHVLHLRLDQEEVLDLHLLSGHELGASEIAEERGDGNAQLHHGQMNSETGAGASSEWRISHFGCFR